MPKLREVSEVYAWDKDGKQRFDPKTSEKGMRK